MCAHVVSIIVCHFYAFLFLVYRRLELRYTVYVMVVLLNGQEFEYGLQFPESKPFKNLTELLMKNVRIRFQGSINNANIN